MLTYAIIPARSGSKGVPDKNIRVLAGHPLLAWSIAAAKLCPSISRVIVSTDSEEYAKIALHYGAEVPFLRPGELSADTSTDREFLIHALHWFEEHDKVLPEYIALLRPTTPFREPQCIEEALKKLQNRPDCTSLCSAYELPESPAKYFALCEEENIFKGFMGDEFLSLRRQDCPKAYVWDGCVDVLRSEYLLTTQDVYGQRKLAYITQPSVEIDTESEFAYAEYLAQAKAQPLQHYYLNNKYSKG